MAEYIEREALLKHCYDQPGKFISDISISMFPAADVAPVVRGEWKWNAERTKPFCSECGEVPWRENNRNLPNFCPNCGADMRGGNDG